MKTRVHIIFWIISYLLIFLIFSQYDNSYIQAFYFVCMLFPIVIGTAYFINYWLFPNYLFKGKTVLFIVYLVYTIIVSIYLELVVITIAFIIFAEYSYSNMPPVISEVIVLAGIIYLNATLFSFSLLYIRFRKQHEGLKSLQSELDKKNNPFIVLTSNRKKIKVNLDEITYVESLNDYVKVCTLNQGDIITYERMGNLEKALPNEFIRIHRSFMIHRNNVKSFTSENVYLFSGQELPISRKYKASAVYTLQNN